MANSDKTIKTMMVAKFLLKISQEVFNVSATENGWYMLRYYDLFKTTRFQ
jgi:hypothetical protein